MRFGYTQINLFCQTFFDDADSVFNSLKDKGVLIKNMHPAGGVLENCLRVTVSTPQENHAFLDALKASL